MFKGKKLKLNTKIAGATMVAIFSLTAAFSGSIAWFQTQSSNSIRSGNFEVVQTGSSCGLEGVRLIKFDYSVSDYGSYQSVDWLTPETGHVNSYDYNYESHSFSVDAMNPYDPVEKVIRKTALKELNCNAVYEVSFVGYNIGTTYLELTSAIFEVIKDKKEDILLSDCVDIDIFYEEDLDSEDSRYIAEDNGETALVNEYNNLLYYPSYKTSRNEKYYKYDGSNWVQSAQEPTGENLTNKGTVIYEQYLPNNPSTGDYYQVLKNKAPLGASASEIADAEIYYKISYLSSLIGENSHSHFYGNPKSTNISIVNNKQITFVGDTPVKFYINVNYAPSIADAFMKDIYLNDIVAKYDYEFNFNFLNSPMV